MDLSSFANADRQLSQYHLSERASMANRVRSSLSAEERKAALEVIEKKENDAVVTALAHEFYSQSRATLVQRGAEELAKHVPGLNSAEGIAALVNAYDGSMDFHFRASTHAQTDVALSGRTTGKNDVFDISHFMYIDDHIAIVSDDKLVVGICLKLWPRQHRLIKELLQDVEMNR